MGKNRSKRIYLVGGNEMGQQWDLTIDITTKQQRWQGFFNLRKEVRKTDTKTIYLIGGCEDAFHWKLVINIRTTQHQWMGNFVFRNEVQEYRDRRRCNDRNWAVKTFPRWWLRQFEVHHHWLGGEICYFLTPEEHCEQDRILRYGNT